MCSIDQDKTAWLSGEICVLAAWYRAEGCRHRPERDFIEDDIFTHCPRCNKELQWTPIASLSE